MGLLVDGVWQDRWYDTGKTGGRFVRGESRFRSWVTPDGSPGPTERLAGNVASRAAARPGAPRRGWALLQGIVVCGRCGRRMALRYSGPHGDYPLYQCISDQSQDGSPRCQEVRALPVDATVERLLLEALAPDQIALAVAAMGQLDEEARLLEKQWGLKRERARYEAERARRQYDTSPHCP
jgi:Recombinase zinc beta ribbon domain